MFAFVAVGVFDQSSVFVLFGCTLFAAALFVYVFYQPGEVEAGEEKTRQMYLVERKEATYENLRDLNFEYKAGKLSEQDYAIQPPCWKTKRRRFWRSWSRLRRRARLCAMGRAARECGPTEAGREVSFVGHAVLANKDIVITRPPLRPRDLLVAPPRRMCRRLKPARSQ